MFGLRYADHSPTLYVLCIDGFVRLVWHKNAEGGLGNAAGRGAGRIRRSADGGFEARRRGKICFSILCLKFKSFELWRRGSFFFIKKRSYLKNIRFRIFSIFLINLVFLQISNKIPL